MIEKGIFNTLMLGALFGLPTAASDLLPAPGSEPAGEAAIAADSRTEEGATVSENSQSAESDSRIISGKSVFSDLLESRLPRASLFPEAGAVLHQRINEFREGLDVFDLEASTDYSFLLQHASDTLTGDPTAAGRRVARSR